MAVLPALQIISPKGSKSISNPKDQQPIHLPESQRGIWPFTSVSGPLIAIGHNLKAQRLS